jgi:two-component system, cell cycle sensor histidine kinase and response regulator CckA
MNEIKAGGPVRVLFVDDEENILRSVKRLFMEESYEVLTANSGEEALELLKDGQDIGLIVSDQRMPGMQGVDLLKQASEISPDTLRIMLTGYTDINAAIDAINKGGAYQYITKPWKDDELIQIVRDAVYRYSLIRENKRLAEIVKRQNEELKQWNDQLQYRVQEQTVEIRESEEKFRRLFDEAPVGYHEVDKEGRITNVNDSELEMLGYTAEEMLGQPIWKFTAEPETIKQVFEARITGDLPPGQAFECTYCRKDGMSLVVLAGDKLLKERAGMITGIRTTIQNITELKQTEEKMASLQKQFHQAQKMEAVGRLTGGIAHDFNNLLTIIKGYSQLSLIGLKDSKSLKENIEEIYKASERATELTRQLLAFSRHQIMEMKVLDLNFLLHNLDKMFRRAIGEDIELVNVLADDLGRVKADPGQIEQVIMNLVVNARDAMPSGGKLTIGTANVELDELYIHRYIGAALGRYVELLVSDTGMGMTPEVKDHIFEPFFTTKEKDKGTGLGLSVVYGIVKQSGGNIWVYSEPGQGTVFKIHLPRVDEPLQELQEKVEVAEIPRGSETVLVVEDEDQLRKLITQVLQTQGYEVLETSSGDDALMIYKERKEPIHLLLTDVVMPRMSGVQLVDRCRKESQELKVLYMSGYVESVMIHHEVLVTGINYIRKPFTVHSLARKVRDILDQDSKQAV